MGMLNQKSWRRNKFMKIDAVIKISLICLLACAMGMMSCRKQMSSHDEMILLLAQAEKKSFNPDNSFSPAARLKYCDSVLQTGEGYEDALIHSYYKAKALLQLGEEEKAITVLETLRKKVKENSKEETRIINELALAYLRLGEQTNCVSNHAAESCILPIKGLGLHKDISASEKAKALYALLVKRDPDDLESRWLFNIACMTLGEYPGKIPATLLIPHLDGDTTAKVNPFQDVAADLKLNINNQAGGSVVDDFDNDGYLDIITSSSDLNEGMHYLRNNADGTFEDLSERSGLGKITGGLNAMQTDYNNDGLLDVFVLRGGWRGEFGKEPNSLLKNNGNGTFTDVTAPSGLLSFHPTQTATWNDFNNDGWLDVFIGNETDKDHEPHPCELFINNKNGTFTNVAQAAKCAVIGYVKGVTSGDYNNDGWQDLFISTMDGNRFLLKNKGEKEIQFEDVTKAAGLANDYGRTFPTWFWDYNNDGWLDIFVCDYTFDRPLSYYTAAECLNIPAGNPDKMFLYKNNQDGTFTNVAKEVGLTKNVFAMGSNFGDIDNDGFLDMYLGTGHPDFRSLIPNKMFKNMGGTRFADVTNAARVGHLQKGHGVSFADIDHDGDQDIYLDMGGVYKGDSYQNSFFLNPGQGNNKWIGLKLEGSASNKAAVGSRIKISFKENGVMRNVFRDVNSGGSFGASPLRLQIGIGQAEKIDTLQITWGGSNRKQILTDIKANQFIRVSEGGTAERMALKGINWMLPDQLCIPADVTAHLRK
jgi:hypothetical protein